MNIQKNKRLPLLMSALLVSLIGASLYIFSEKQVVDFSEDSGSFEKWKLIYEQYDRAYPMLRSLNIQRDVQGTSTLLGDGWTRYENVPLRFSIEYPRHTRHQEKGKKVFFSERPYDDPLYAVTLTHEDADDTPVTVVKVRASRFSNIWDWLAHDIYSPRNDSSVNILYENLHGNDALISFPVARYRETTLPDQHPLITDEHIPRDVYIIKNGLLYIITTKGVSTAERERILNSFRFLENE